jgi:stage II sporulation protein D
MRPLRLTAALLCLAAISRAGITYRVKLASSDGGRIIDVLTEQYVAGVLAGESSVFESDEGLKAMAIVARTYAARMRSRHEAEGYDFCSTTHCQRFDPAGIQSRFLAIAQATAGKLLWYEGRPAFAAYSRDCGGTTENASSVWPDVEAPYLRVKTDPYCTRKGQEQWSWAGDPSEIVRALHTSGLRCPEQLQRINILNRTDSHRIRTLSLEGRSGSTAISESSFRFAIGRMLGWNTLRSDRYQVLRVQSRLEFHGTGEGHGVGLCQHGADEMGRQGYKFDQILAFYYPGTTVALTGAGLHWTRLGGEHLTVFTTQPQQEGRVLSIAEQLEQNVRQQLRAAPARLIRIYIYPDIDTFRNATGEPGWVAAHTRSNRIDLQPLSDLEGRGILRQTLNHELLHVTVENEAAPSLPLWFREGLVGWITHDNSQAGYPVGQPLDAAMRQRDNAAVARRAYQQSSARVGALVGRYGEETVLDWLRRGLPADVINASTSSATTNTR